MNKLSAIILAAGSSSRMGEPKALLKIGKETFIERIYKTLLLNSFLEIIIVLGKDYDKIINFLGKKLKVKYVRNIEYQKGQLSSVHVGIRNISESSEGILISLVDMPLIQKETVRKLIETWRTNRDKIIIPEFEGRGGHPVIFPKKFFNELLSAPMEEGARFVVYNNSSEVIRVPVHDYGVRKDFDYPEELSELDL